MRGDGAAARGAGPTYAWYVVGVLMFAYVVSFIDRLILGLLVQPIKADLGISDTQVGLLAGVGFALFYTVMGVPLARVADRSNRKWLIVAGVTLWSLMTAASAFATSFTGLLVARIGVGVGEATLAPAASSMIADYFARDRVARAMGVYSTGVYLGSGVALLAGSLVVAAVTGSGPRVLPGLGTFNAWQLAFLVAALPGALVVALMLTVREPPRTEHAGAAATGGSGRREAPTFRELLQFLRANRRLLAAHGIGYGALGTAVTAWLVWAPEMLRRSFDVTIGEAAFVYGALLVTLGTAGPFVGGWWAQRAVARGHPDAEIRVSMLATMALSPLVIAAPLMPSLGVTAVVLAPVVLLLAVPQGLAATVLQLVSPNRLRGQVLSSFMLVAVLLAYLIGPTSVPLLAKWVFGSEQELDRALSLLCGVLIPTAAVALAVARKPFGALMAASGRGDPRAGASTGVRAPDCATG
jgi:MFS family permease